MANQSLFIVMAMNVCFLKSALPTDKRNHWEAEFSLNIQQFFTLG